MAAAARDGCSRCSRAAWVTVAWEIGFATIASRSGAGLLDRLIAADCRRTELVALTLDSEMSALAATQLLLTSPAHQEHRAGLSPS